MSGIRGSGEVRLVAAIASGGQRCVVVVYMACSTGHGGVGAGQRERRGVVIKGGARPIRGAVACGARGWETGCCMRRTVGPCEIGLVAAIAGSGQRCVVVVGMARGASHGGVGAGQREGGVVVIES